MAKAFAASIVVLAVIVIFVTLVQWLFACFGWYFGFWKTLGIILVVDIICTVFFKGGKK